MRGRTPVCYLPWVECMMGLPGVRAADRCRAFRTRPSSAGSPSGRAGVARSARVAGRLARRLFTGWRSAAPTQSARASWRTSSPTSRQGRRCPLSTPRCSQLARIHRRLNLLQAPGTQDRVQAHSRQSPRAPPKCRGVRSNGERPLSSHTRKCPTGAVRLTTRLAMGISRVVPCR